MSRTYGMFRAQCGHDGCKEFARYEADNRSHYMDLSNRYGNGKWRCVRHSQPDQVLSETNSKTTETLRVIKSGEHFLLGQGKAIQRVLPRPRVQGFCRGLSRRDGDQNHCRSYPAERCPVMIAAIRIPTPEEIKARRARLGFNASEVRPRPQIALVASPGPVASVSNNNEVRQIQPEDWHVRAWWAWKAWRGDDMLIMQYVRACCWMAGTTVQEVRSESRQSDVVAKRHVVIKSACMRFPEVSQVRMGKLFNRDHTVIGWILRCKTKNIGLTENFRAQRTAKPS